MSKYLFVAVLTLVVFPFGVQAAVVNINTANVAQLDTLPGIGPSKAAAIVDYRMAYGPFVKIEDIQNVKGIGLSTFAGLKSVITVDPVTVTVPSAAVVVQPQQPVASSPSKQTTKAVVANNLTEPAHAEDAVSAPGTTSELAAPGAALRAVPPAAELSEGILRSPWMLAFLGLLMFAGGALMIL